MDRGSCTYIVLVAAEGKQKLGKSKRKKDVYQAKTGETNGRQIDKKNNCRIAALNMKSLVRKIVKKKVVEEKVLIAEEQEDRHMK